MVDFFELEKIVREKGNIPHHHTVFLSYDGKEIMCFHGSGYAKLHFHVVEVDVDSLSSSVSVEVS